MSNVLSSVPLCRVKYIRTVGNVTISPDHVTAEPTVSFLTVPGQHGYIDLVTVTSGSDPLDPTVGYLDLVVTDDTDVLEAFGWTIRFLNSTRPTQIVSVPQSGANVSTVTVGGVSMPSVWLDTLATFTGPSGATGSDVATRSYVDDSLDAHEAAPDPHPQYALDSDVSTALAAVRQVPTGGANGQVLQATGSGAYAWLTPNSAASTLTPTAIFTSSSHVPASGEMARYQPSSNLLITLAAAAAGQRFGVANVLPTTASPAYTATFTCGGSDTFSDATTSIVLAPGERAVLIGISGGFTIESRTQRVTYGTTAGTAAQGNDPRIVGAAQSFTQRTTTATANTTAADNEIVPLNTSGGTFTLTGPTSGKPFGWRWTAGTAANAPTVAAPAGYTIAGATSITPSLPPSGSSAELVLWQPVGTDYQPIGGFKGQSQLNAQHGAILNTHLKAWVFSTAFQIAAQRVDTVATTSGSSTVTDPSITANDVGRPVSGAGIPSGSYVGTVTPSTSFLLSSSPTTQTAVTATATASGGSATLLGAARDTNEAIQVAAIVWPDGSLGTFTTTTASASFPGAIDAYTATYVPASGRSWTVTQAAVTRDTGGAVVSQPALAVA